MSGRFDIGPSYLGLEPQLFHYIAQSHDTRSSQYLEPYNFEGNFIIQHAILTKIVSTMLNQVTLPLV